MKMNWIRSSPHYWRLYFREPTQFVASLRRRDEDGWFEYCLRMEATTVPGVYTKLEGITTLEEAQAAVQVIAATNR